MEKAIFRRGSRTYFWSSVFFPKTVRHDVQKFYSFVRVADDYVDVIPARKKEFYELRRAWDVACQNPHFNTDPAENDALNDRVVKHMVYVTRAYDFSLAWVDAFFDSMESDLQSRRYRAWSDTLQYMYGSAEVIALMMCRILGVGPEGYQSAKMLGRAMQQINFIRDIGEDVALGRCYFPQSALRQAGLKHLEQPSTSHAAFDAFVRSEIERYRAWQAEAEAGYQYLPKRLLPAIQTASDMYYWTAEQIYKQPMRVFSEKVKPSWARILYAGLKNSLRR